MKHHGYSLLSRLLAVVVCISIVALAAPGGWQPAKAQEISPASAQLTPGAEYAPGQLLMRFRPGVSAPRADEILAQRGLTRQDRINALSIDLLRLPQGLSVERAVDIFSRHPEVEFAEPNYVLHALEISNQWGLEQIGAEQAWAEVTDPAPVLIATVDTGIDRNHTDLSGNIWTNPDEIAGNGVDDENGGVGNGYVDDTWGWDFVNNDNDPMDDMMHGTAVSSVAAGVQDGAGVAGVCPWCKLMSVKVLDALGSGTLDAVAQGVIYAADNGAQVINLSLGAASGSATLQNAITHAWGQGAVVVAAAGNNGLDQLFYPAAYPEAIAVGSTNRDDYRSCFSNYHVDFIDVMAPGEGVLAATPNQSYGTYDGTSLAAPHVTGLAGLLFSQDTMRLNSDVRNLIEESALDLGPEGVDAYFGWGRIDAYRAVTGDTSATTPPMDLTTNDPTATGYAHARKLARDSTGRLHWVWHSQTDGQYQVLYASSEDDGRSWTNPPQVVFSSSAETYHPALTVDDENVYIAFPSMYDSLNNSYSIFFSSKALDSGAWSTDPPAPLGGGYDAVRPDLHVDPVTGKIHLVASSLDNAANVYHTWSSDKGLTWSSLKTIPVGFNSRYADVYAYDDRITIATRTLEFWLGLIPQYHLRTFRSEDGGVNWTGSADLATHMAIIADEYGVSLDGTGPQLMLSYEHAGSVYARHSSDGLNWTAGALLGTGAWPSLTQAAGGQAWVLWDQSSTIAMRHYTGSAWEPVEILGTGIYPNLKAGTGDSLLEWVVTRCGAPYCMTYKSQYLGDNAPPTASFSASALDLTVTFTDSSSDSDGSIVAWSWDFGDGNTSTLQNPSHTYAAAGTYGVSLTVTDDDGATDSTSQDVTVTAPNVSPTARFTFSTGDLTVDFADDSTDSDGTVVSWSWDFGDGNTSMLQNPSHTYAAAGTYGVSLTVTDDDGATDSTSQGVTVTAPNVSPTARFSYSTGDLTADFADDSTDSDGTVVSWSWDFGDGNTSTEQNPSHTYAAAGTYGVSLTVTDDDGATDSTSQDVTVTEPHVYVDYVATGEILIAGTVTGSYVDTQVANGAFQSIEERESGGKPANRHTYLEHKWIFDVPAGGATTTFYANVWAPSSDDGDQFEFYYSTDDITYSLMFTVAATGDDGSYQTFDLGNASGTIYIQVVDTDRTPTHRLKDKVSVDHMYIRTDSAPSEPPTAPSGLSATAISSSQIDLTWTDNSDNELGFHIERLEGANWTQVASVSANVTTFSDTGLDPETTYYYRVQAYNSAPPSEYSNTANDTTPAAVHMQVTALNPSSLIVRNKWNAMVEIWVTELDGFTPVVGATVAGLWSDGATGTVECTTDGAGKCTVEKTSIKTQVPSVTFAVTGVTHTIYSYAEESSETNVIVPQ